MLSDYCWEKEREMRKHLCCAVLVAAIICVTVGQAAAQGRIRLSPRKTLSSTFRWASFRLGALVSWWA